jgi:peptidoglycan hydrolase CwlO-like protein
MSEKPLKPVSELLAEIERLRGKAEEAEKKCRDIQDRIVELRKDLARQQGQ